MSRVGKRPITIPKGVEVRYADRVVQVKGPKGESRFEMPNLVDLEVNGEEIKVLADYIKDAKSRAMMGTVQACLSNMVLGVSEGFTRKLRLVGVGYRAAVAGQKIDFQLGFSHPVSITLPSEVKAEMEGNNVVVLSSHNNVVLGQIAANIRALRPPEPYQGKGISYENERIRRKAGKTGKK